jgi:hypothetical protein
MLRAVTVIVRLLSLNNMIVESLEDDRISLNNMIVELLEDRTNVLWPRDKGWIDSMRESDEGSTVSWVIDDWHSDQYGRPNIDSGSWVRRDDESNTGGRGYCVLRLQRRLRMCAGVLKPSVNDSQCV